VLITGINSQDGSRLGILPKPLDNPDLPEDKDKPNFHKELKGHG
jgi:hypothetical protein